MNCFKFILIFSVFLGVSLVSYSSPADFQKALEKVKLTGPSDISAKANTNSSCDLTSPIFMQDPLLNGMVNGLGNMVQGTTGASYNAQEQTKQQMDYAKQQMQYEQED